MAIPIQTAAIHSNTEHQAHAGIPATDTDVLFGPRYDTDALVNILATDMDVLFGPRYDTDALVTDMDVLFRPRYDTDQLTCNPFNSSSPKDPSNIPSYIPSRFHIDKLDEVQAQPYHQPPFDTDALVNMANSGTINPGALSIQVP
jgi:hypothetical protein